MNEDYKEINILEIAEVYKPGIKKYAPKFLIKYLTKVLHIDALNYYNKNVVNKDREEFFTTALKYLKLDYSTVNFTRDNMPNVKNPLFVSNHPLGAPEAIATMKELLVHFSETKVVSRKYMKMIKDFAPSIIAVTDRRELLEGLKDENLPLLIYPSGRNSRYFKINGKKELIDLKWQDSFIKFAKRYNRPIVAINCDGIPYKKYHKISRARKALGLKATIEALFLVEGMFNIKDKFKLTLGDTIYPEDLTEDVSLQEWADRIMQYVHELKYNPNAKFDKNKANELLVVDKY